MTRRTDWLAARSIVALRLDNAGDVIMLGPALRAIKETSPAAQLTLVASRAGAVAATLLPWVDDVIVWRPVWQDIGGQVAQDPARDRAVIAGLARRHLDAALIFTSFSQTPHVPGYVCYLAGIPLRAGESKEFGGGTLTDEPGAAPDGLHQVERNLRLVEHLGFQARDRHLAIAIPEAARAAVTGLLADAGFGPGQRFVLLHPGASARARRLPERLCREVAAGLAADGWPVLVSGVEREADLVHAVIGPPAERSALLRPLVGRTTLAEYAALVERAALVICGNTLPLHLADALGTPVVTLYAGTDLESQWAPRGAPARVLRRATACYPCYRFDCPIGQACLALPPTRVLAACHELLGTAPAAGVHGRLPAGHAGEERIR